MWRLMKSCAEGVELASLDPRVSKLALLLRVSGPIQQFEGNPVEGVKIGRDRSYISCDLLVWIPEWEGQSRAHIAGVLADRVRRVPDVLAPVCQKRKVAIDRDRLARELNDYAECLARAGHGAF